MTRAEIRRQKKTYDKDFRRFCKTIHRVLGLETTEFLPHYVTINDLLKKLELSELEKLRNRLVYDLLRSRRFESARFQKRWLVIIDATGLFHLKKGIVTTA